MATNQHPPHRAQSEQPSEGQSASNERKLREEHLLDAAATLLVRWGYRKTTIDDVAREAGVGKGTIYLHWKDKNELFRAAIWRAQLQLGDEIRRRIAADPEGGLLHRIMTHGMLAALSDPLMSAIIRGKSDIFNGFVGAYEPGFFTQLIGDADTYVVQLQQAGLIRTDISASMITSMLTALKVGVINLPDIISQEQLPSIEQLTETLSDLIRRWLEPEQLPSESETGKKLFTELLDKVKEAE